MLISYVPPWLSAYGILFHFFALCEHKIIVYFDEPAAEADRPRSRVSAAFLHEQ